MKKNQTLLYIIFTLIIISSGSLMQSKITTTGINLIIFILLLLLFSSSDGFIKKLQFNRFLLFVYIVLITYFGFLINIDDLKVIRLLTIQFSLLILITMLLIFCLNNNIKFLIILSNIIVFISIYTLIFYVMISIFKINLPGTIIGYASNGIPFTSYFNMYFTWQDVNWWNHTFSRNQAIFWEPGVYQIYLNFALIIELFIKDKVNYKILVILFLCIVTTFSTTGIILALGILYYKLLTTKSNSPGIKFSKFILIPIVGLLVIYISNYVLFQKINFGTDNYLSRSNSIIVSLELFMERPFFGWGYLNSADFIRKQSSMLEYYWADSAPFTNGLLAYLYQNGIFGLFIYGISSIFVIRFFKINKIIFIFIVFFIVSNSTEPVIGTNFMLMFLSYGYSLYIYKGMKKIQI